MKEIGKVIESNSSNIKIRLNDMKDFEDNKIDIKIGKYVSIQEGNFNHILAIIQNIKTSEEVDSIRYLLEVQPIGSYIIDEENFNFKQGSANLPSPTEPVFIPDSNIITKIFDKNSTYSYYLGKLSNNDQISYFVNGNSFFSKHVGVVGSTGSGKSCAVSKIIQEIVGINNNLNKNKELQKNAHIIIFDIHSEYKSAFELDGNENFNLNNLDVEKMCIPYWLMNSEELESLFIESNELNSHNQVSQFKKAA